MEAQFEKLLIIFASLRGVVALAGVVLAVLILKSRNRSKNDLRSRTITPVNSATQQVCKTLAFRFSEVTHTREDDEFWQCLKSYWAVQAQTPKPALVIRPQNVGQLSRIIKVLSDAVNSSGKDEPVQFAIKSGGHSPVQGLANVDSGIVIDLGLFNEIELSDDRQLVDIGPGATWGLVYRTLAPYGLSVAGGRASSVGVGGLTLGGGLSFFSPQVGFVCDAMVNFEVVLADGSIINANDKSHPDLAIALRGGGNNFGIVTKFTARTFPQSKVWFGHLFHWPSAVDRLLQAFYDFGEAKPYDKKATCIFTLAWAPYLPFFLPVTCLNYAEPTPHPKASLRLSREKKFWSTLGVRSLAEATDKIENMSDANKRDLFHTTTFENDLETLQCAHAVFKETLNDVKKVPGMVWSLCFQPLFPSATLHHATNSMGINTDKTLTIMHVNVVWKRAEDDHIVNKAAAKILDCVEDFARERGVYNAYKYANYCSGMQNPYSGYGKERHRFLKDVSRRYDPNGIFQKGVPGHKL